MNRWQTTTVKFLLLILMIKSLFLFFRQIFVIGATNTLLLTIIKTMERFGRAFKSLMVKGWTIFKTIIMKSFTDISNQLVILSAEGMFFIFFWRLFNFQNLKSRPSLSNILNRSKLKKRNKIQWVMQVELLIYMTIKSDRCTVIMFSIIN